MPSLRTLVLLLAWVLLLPGVAPPLRAAEVDLHFFWSASCPHCTEARPFVEALPARHPWVRLHSWPLSGNPEHVRRYVEMAASLGEEARAVPAFIFCGRLVVGWEDEATSGAALLTALEACRDGEGAGGAAGGAEGAPTRLPLLGEVTPERWSLPLLTVVIAALDAFNPCAFFVLLFLLSLLVHLRSRLRMALVGGLFVAVSGLLYFLFMSAWLNLFLLVGEQRLVSVAAGAVALLMGGLNVKDFFFPAVGPSLSMEESRRARLYARIRALVQTARWPALLAATALLAVAANSYELLCTAGLPMLYTRILTLQGLTAWGYYGYLALYNLIYVVPLALIVALFVRTLGSRKLGAAEGRQLKLLSGGMMAGLGGVLLLAPELLAVPWVALGIPVAALLLVLAARGTWRRGGSAGASRGPRGR